MLRRSLLTTAVVSLAGALTPTIPAKAGTDPVAFVNNLTTQLEMVAGNPSPEQRRAGFRQLFHEDFDCPRLGRFVLGRFSRILSPSERKEFLSRQSRNQTGGRRQASSSAVRAILDDPPIHIRPVCSRKRGCEGQEPCGFNAFQHAHGCTPPPPRPQDSSHVLSRVSS